MSNFRGLTGSKKKRCLITNRSHRMIIHVWAHISRMYQALNIDKTVHTASVAWDFRKIAKSTTAKMNITFTIMFIEFVLNLYNHIPCVTWHDKMFRIDSYVTLFM